MTEQRTVYGGRNGGVALVDGDGGSTPMMIQAQRQPARDTDCACADDSSAVYFQDVRCSGDVETALWKEIEKLHKLADSWAEVLRVQGRALDTAQSHIRLLQAQVAHGGTTAQELTNRTLQLEKRFLLMEGVVESTQATAAETRSDLAALADRVQALELARVAETAED